MSNKKQFIIRDLRNGDWYWIHREVYKNYVEKIGVIGLALYNAYASYSNGEGIAYPSYQTLSKELKISEPTIAKYNKILEENKLIRVDSGKIDGRNNIISLIKIVNRGLNDVKRGLKEVKRGSKAGLEGGLNEVKTNKNYINNNYKQERGEAPFMLTKDFFSCVKSKDEKYVEFISLLVEKYNVKKEWVETEVDKFYNYWTELNHSGTRERWQTEKTFEVKRRLASWFLRANEFSGIKGRVQKMY